MRNNFRPCSWLLGAACTAIAAATTAAEPVGYKDTPMLPGQPWHVHDPDRPQPRVVTPGATFSHLAPPPADAIVLFDGKDLSKWKCDKGEARWKVEDGYMEIVKNSGSIFTKEEFGDFQLHLEWATPEKIVSNSQGRGNSGVLIFGVYEVQVLDSYENRTYPDGQAGSMYGQYPPLVNPVKKPGEWQTYDIIFEAPQWDAEGQLTKKASVTVLLNGVAIHNKKEYLGHALHKVVGTYGKDRRSRGPILLQDHGNPIRFRNIWLRNLGDYDKP